MYGPHLSDHVDQWQQAQQQHRHCQEVVYGSLPEQQRLHQREAWPG
jgi:hypothetical protein